MKSNFRRVSRKLPCPICGKPDWCLVSGDAAIAICSRIQSEKPAGNRGAGWIHRMEGDRLELAFQNRQPIPPKRESKPQRDWAKLHRECRVSLKPARLGWLANELGISSESMELLQVGYADRLIAFTFPMRSVNGSVIGLRTRGYDGQKRSFKGSKAGLFFAPKTLRRECLFIVEGPSDLASIFDVGIGSAIGRDSCRGNVAQIQTLVARLRPERLVIVADRDCPGMDGANCLANQLVQAGYPQSNLAGVVPPEPYNDLREWLNSDFEGMQTVVRGWSNG